MKTGSDDDGGTFNNTLVLSFVGQTRCALTRILIGKFGKVES